MLSSLMLTAVLFAGQDPEPESLPKGPAPKLMSVTGAETFAVLETVTVPVTVTKTVIVEKDGKKETKVVNETVMVAQQRYVTVTLKGAKAKTVGGKALDAEAVAAALKKPQVIVVSADGKAIDPAFLRMLKPETLIVELPAGITTPAVRPLPAIRPAVPVPAPAVPPAVIVPPVIIED